MNSNRFDRIRKIYSANESYLGYNALKKAQFSSAEFLGELFCPGPFYFYILDSPTLTFDNVSESLQEVLGYEPQNFQLSDLIEIIHPEDFQFVLQCEDRVAKFILNDIKPEDIFNYKFCYNFRQKRKDGVYRHFFLQTIVMNTQEDGGLLKVFGVHTDISNFGPVINRNLYFHGMNGAPSYCINDVWEGELLSNKTTTIDLSKRELEVANLMAEGLTAKQIAQRLHLAEETVITHRKNLLKKTGCKNAVELVAKLIRNASI